MKTNFYSIFVILGIIFFASTCTDDSKSTPKLNNNETCIENERTCLDEHTLQACIGTKFVTISCLANETCVSDDCVPLDQNCSNQCDPPETRCTKKGKVKTCGDHNNDGCFEFGDAIACEEGSLCDPNDGLCKPNTCADQCAANETKCEDELITTCIRAGNGCLEFNPGKECPENQICEKGACVAPLTCKDECEIGKDICNAEGQIRVCMKGEKGCGMFSTPTACSNAEACKDGKCIAKGCSDICIKDEKTCVGNGFVICQKSTEGCLEFSAPKQCAVTETCKNDNGNVSCVAPPQTGQVVINEIFYDPTGSDLRNGKSPAFIELKGPAGLDISNYTIELMNGSGGAMYGTFQLPLNAKLDGNGFAIITSDTPDSFLGRALPFFTNVFAIMTSNPGSDPLQNGPDGVVLKDDSNAIIDALGYGKVDPAFFVGEGSCTTKTTCHAAPDVFGGHSLGRIDGKDTDDNEADFHSFYPTPGIPNSDLLINEIYFDEPGKDNGTETFVELIAPIIGWEDMTLEGYSLHAINGFNGKDYIFTGINPGIEMGTGSGSDKERLNQVGDGFVVICNIDTANSYLISRCTVPYEGVDWQNGPDNFILRYKGKIIDAVAYGSFTGTATFVGEGQAKDFSITQAGKALARWPISDTSHPKDTDDNRADFHVVSPTPNATNQLPSP